MKIRLIDRAFADSQPSEGPDDSPDLQHQTETQDYVKTMVPGTHATWKTKSAGSQIEKADLSTSSGPRGFSRFNATVCAVVISALLVMSCFSHFLSIKSASTLPTLHAIFESDNYLPIEQVQLGQRVYTNLNQQQLQTAVGIVESLPWWDTVEIQPENWRRFPPFL